MKFSNLVRLHWAALRALLVLTVLTGLAYPLLVWAVAQLPGLRDKADGSMKADAVGVALEIDRLASRHPHRRTV